MRDISVSFPRDVREGEEAERARRGAVRGGALTDLTGTSLIPENERKGSVSDIVARAWVSRQNDGSSSFSCKTALLKTLGTLRKAKSVQLGTSSRCSRFVCLAWQREADGHAASMSNRDSSMGKPRPILARKS